MKTIIDLGGEVLSGVFRDSRLGRAGPCWSRMVSMSEEIAGYGENWESDPRQQEQLKELRRLRRLQLGLLEPSSETSAETPSSASSEGSHSPK